MNAQKLISPLEAAARLGVKPDTLAAWRSRNYPDLPFVRVGRKILYRASDIEAFIRRNLIRPGKSARRNRSEAR